MVAFSCQLNWKPSEGLTSPCLGPELGQLLDSWVSWSCRLGCLHVLSSTWWSRGLTSQMATQDSRQKLRVSFDKTSEARAV